MTDDRTLDDQVRKLLDIVKCETCKIHVPVEHIENAITVITALRSERDRQSAAADMIAKERDAAITARNSYRDLWNASRTERDAIAAQLAHIMTLQQSRREGQPINDGV